MKKNQFDIIIPSFNGKYLLEKHLPEIFANSDQLNQIILVDNGSTDGTVEWLSTNYPEINVIQNDSNLGFTRPVNQGVSASTSEYFVLLNNDVRPEKNFLKDILRFFEDERVFAVSFNESGSSWPLVSWKDGKVQFSQSNQKDVAYYSLWASGGSAIFRRSIWDKLGGFNEIYAPYYWEDIDIGYRAWKSGYKIISDTKSIVHHEHESTSKKVNPRYLNLIKQRNELLFTWLNITDRKLLFSHISFLLSHSTKHPGYLQVVFSALLRLSSNKISSKFIRSDQEVLSSVNRPFLANPADLSIIVVGYKSEPTIVPFLDSIQKSKDGLRKEIIVVDNYPLDGGADLAEKHPLKPIVIRNQENIGFSKAVNQALKVSSGQFILLINPDTRVVGKALRYLYDFAKSKSKIGAVAPMLLDDDGKTQASCYMFPSVANAIRYYFLNQKNRYNKYFPGKRTTKVDIAVMAAFLFPRSTYEKVGGLDERFFLYYEDVEYCRRLHQFGLPIYFYPKAKVKHTHGASGNFKSHKASPLARSAQIYHGIVGSFLLNLVLWSGQKWQKTIFKLFRSKR